MATETQERRISAKAHELYLYCAQRADSMTEQSFIKARESLRVLLNTIIDKNKEYPHVAQSVLSSTDFDNPYANHDIVAYCSEKQAESLAKSIVYGWMPDDSNLYPVKAEEKLNRAELRQIPCSIPSDEMTINDCLFIIWSNFNVGSRFTRNTILAAFNKLKEKGFSPSMAKFYATLFYIRKPISLKDMKDRQYVDDYPQAVKKLEKQGYILKNSDDTYSRTSMIIH